MSQKSFVQKTYYTNVSRIEMLIHFYGFAPWSEEFMRVTKKSLARWRI